MTNPPRAEIRIGDRARRTADGWFTAHPALRAHDFVTDGSDGVWTRLTGGGEPAGPPVRLGSPPPASHAQPLAGSASYLRLSGSS
jgi:hypothetical protein